MDYFDLEKDLPNYWDKQFLNPFEDLVDILKDSISFSKDQVKIKLHKKFYRSSLQEKELGYVTDSQSDLDYQNSTI